MRILSKKMKKGVSWNQSGRNQKLINKAIADGLEIMEQMKQPITLPAEENVVSEDAPTEEKMKYSISQSILAYQQTSKKTFAALVKEIDIKNLTEKKLIDLCRGKFTGFSLGELVIYANNLRITNIPCYHCGVNLYPPLLGEILSAFKNQVSFCPQKVYREHAHHSSSI